MSLIRKERHYCTEYHDRFVFLCGFCLCTSPSDEAALARPNEYISDSCLRNIHPQCLSVAASGGLEGDEWRGTRISIKAFSSLRCRKGKPACGEIVLTLEITPNLCLTARCPLPVCRTRRSRADGRRDGGKKKLYIREPVRRTRTTNP